MQTPKRFADPLRVAMFTPDRTRCGISDYSHLLMDALRSLPYDLNVRIVAPPDDVPNLSAIQAAHSFGHEARRYAALGAQMNAEGADIAHIQHQYFFFGGVAPHKNHARAFLNAVRIPVVMTVHEVARPPEGANALVRSAIRLTNRRNFLHPHIRALIVHTQADRKELLRLGVKENVIHLITHAVPPALPMPSNEEAKRSLGLEDRRIVTLFGFLAAKKGHSLALDAVPFLPYDVTLLFAGGQHPQDTTDYVAQLQARIERENLSERVRITDYLPEAQIPVVMAATDVAIAPFTQTSGSGSLANLFAYGRATVASDIAPHQQIASSAPNCLELFQSGNAADLAAHIQAMLDNPQRRKQLQHAALDYAQRHSYLDMAEHTRELYYRNSETHQIIYCQF
jgi:glycosyltransferase involved in cell wall biosynthesis